MKDAREFIDAEVVILSAEEGGRRNRLSPAAYKGRYKPHIVLQSRRIREAEVVVVNGLRVAIDEYLAIAFWSGPDDIPISKPFTVTMVLTYAPHRCYDKVQPDTEFTIREGHIIVGHGKVLKRWVEKPSE